MDNIHSRSTSINNVTGLHAPLSLRIPRRNISSSTIDLALPMPRSNMSMENVFSATTATNTAAVAAISASINFTDYIKEDMFDTCFYRSTTTAESPISSSTPSTAVGTFTNLSSLLSPSSVSTAPSSSSSVMGGMNNNNNCGSPVSPIFTNTLSKLRISSSPNHTNAQAPLNTPTLDFAFGVFGGGGALVHNAVRQLKEEAASSNYYSHHHHHHHHNSSSCDSLNLEFMSAIGFQDETSMQTSGDGGGGGGLDSANSFNKTNIVTDALLAIEAAYNGGAVGIEFNGGQEASIATPTSADVALTEEDIMNMIMMQNQQQFLLTSPINEEAMMMAALFSNNNNNNSFGNYSLEDEYEDSNSGKSNSRRGSGGNIGDNYGSSDAVDFEDEDGDFDDNRGDSKRLKSSSKNNNKKLSFKSATASSASLEAIFSSNGVVTAAESAKSRNWKCFIPGCDRVYNTGAGLRYHVKNHHQLNLLIKATRKPKKEKRREWTCPDCNRSYTSLPGLKYHQSTAEHKATVAALPPINGID